MNKHPDSMTINIYSLYVIKLAKWFNLVMPIFVLFYQSTGMTMQDLFILKSIYSITIVLFEIPSGYAADVLGRKRTLLAGSILGALGFVIYSLNHAYLGFAVAEIILGLGHSFISGADSAMLYDTLLEKGRASRYLELEGRITAVGNFAEALAGIIGGFLAVLSLRMPFYFQTLVAASAIPAALMLKEPCRDLISHKMEKISDLLVVVRKAFLENRVLLWMLLVSALTGLATLTFAWFVQPWFKEAGLPIALYGVMWTLLNLTAGATGLFAHRVEKNVDKTVIILGIVILIGTGFILSGVMTSLYAVFILFFFYAVRGVASPLLKNAVHRHCDSTIRATVFSLRNFVIRINFAVGAPILGWLTDSFDLKTALVAAGCFYLALAFVCAVFQLKNERQSEYK